MHRTRIIIAICVAAFAASVMTATAGAHSLGGKPKKDEWCRTESCPANPPATFKVNEKKKTWELKSSGKITEEGKKVKFTETFKGTFTITGGTYKFIETEGSVDGEPARYELELTAVKTATGFNSPEHPGKYVVGIEENFEEGWWTENN